MSARRRPGCCVAGATGKFGLSGGTRVVLNVAVDLRGMGRMCVCGCRIMASSGLESRYGT